MPLEFFDLETVYESLAEAMDQVADADRELFLSKLALLMARQLGNAAETLEMIQEARKHLEHLEQL